MRQQPDFARAVALARRAREPRRGAQTLVFAAILAAGLHGASVIASLGAAADVPSARTREVDVMKLSKIAAIGAVSVASSAWAGGKNLITNGGFEQGPLQKNCAWVLYGAGNNQIEGWRVVWGNIDRERMTEQCPIKTEVWRTFEGEFTIDLTGTENGTMCQDVTLSIGSRYRLSFALTGNGIAPTTMPLQVRIGSLVAAFEFACADQIPQPWTMRSMDFTATAQTNEICFVSNSTTFSAGAVIDQVVLTEISCPADVIADGVVDGADLTAVLTVWGTNGGIHPRADTNADGVVDSADLATVLGGWGLCP